MNYSIKPTPKFLKHLNSISAEGLRILENKLILAKSNPFRNKKLTGHKETVFRIRFKDRRKEKRVIYCVYELDIILICILDRDKDYKDLKKYLKQSLNNSSV